MQRAERQVVKHKGRWRARKRQPKPVWAAQGTPQEVALSVGTSTTAAVPVVVHAFPAYVRMHEAHIVESTDSVALRPMTIEEAVKEAEFRDREVFVFRDVKENKVKVLHRKKDGKMEIIEAP
jgi:putative sigma-54 modulation protein